MSWKIRLFACMTICAVNLAVPAVPVRPKPWLHTTFTAKTLDNSIHMKLVRIEPGSFVMGSPIGEEGRNNHEQQHEVEITKPFYIGKYEVTQEEYQKVMNNNPSSFSPNGNDRAKVMGLQTQRFPVEMVSWNDAKAYCRKLTELERNTGHITADMEYTLPTEAEWEYCCRAGTQTPFHFGASISAEQANYSANQIFGKGQPGVARGRPVEVGSFPPNAWGLHDMHGNVDEWCEDWYDTTYYPVSPRRDPPGSNKGSIRMLRGGSWSYRPQDCRSALRDGTGADTRLNFAGFRIVLRMWPRSQ
jgi:formylglycine-generating enzyme required for sulfatase activity